MGSSMSSGHAAKVAQQVRASECPKAKDGKHDWEAKGSWPSTWGECRKCGDTYFDK